MSDFRYAFRAILQNPGFSAIAILTLALGIGANTAIFSIFDTVLIRPLAYRDPSRLVSVQEIIPKFSPVIPVAASHYVHWRDHARSIDQIALIGGAAFNLTSDAGEPERLPGARVTASMFPLLGIRPLVGRTFLQTEDQPGSDRVTLIGETLWNRRFHADRGIVGRKILLDGDPYTIVGVLPNQPALPRVGELLAIPLSNEGAEIWTPLSLRPNQLPPFANFQFASVARLKPGVTEAQALADFNRMDEDITRPLPVKVELRSVLTPLQQQMTGASRAS